MKSGTMGYYADTYINGLYVPVILTQYSTSTDSSDMNIEVVPYPDFCIQVGFTFMEPIPNVSIKSINFATNTVILNTGASFGFIIQNQNAGIWTTSGFTHTPPTSGTDNFYALLLFWNVYSSSPSITTSPTNSTWTSGINGSPQASIILTDEKSYVAGAG